jgi:hypothetical protein
MLPMFLLIFIDLATLLLYPICKMPFPRAVTAMPSTVIPNQRAAAHWGAVKRCQGCRQIWNCYLFIDVLVQRVPQIVIFNPAEVPPIF